MILLQASHIAKAYDGESVLTDANLTVHTGDRVALVGANGAGKTTLLKIIVGEEAPDAGDVSLAKGVRIGYVSQRVDLDGNETIYEWVAKAFADIFAMEARMRALEAEMAEPEVFADERRFEETAAAYDRLRQQYEDAGGYSLEARFRRVLAGLNFPVDIQQRPVRSLSGGQKTRLSLARLLVTEPELLVLDEPTNYLDTDTLTWLEGYLLAYSGAVLVVSHDRYFLDQVATAIYELDGGKTTRYAGNYSDFVEQKAARLEEDLKRYEAQQQEIARLENFIQKNIARASTTKRAQSRRKLLEKMVRLERPAVHTPKLALRFTPARTSGKDVLRTADLVTGFPGKPLAGPLNLYVARGQRLAIVGPNGIGKTTLLKTLAGKLTPLAGEVHWGTHIHLGYYDQEQTELNTRKTVLQQVWDEHPDLDQTTIRTALGRFLFRGEEVEKSVASLSGGERSRLALCRLMLHQPNVLLLDEPTNHLDLLSKEALEDALAEYEGTLIFVSHDRYFVDALATHVLALEASRSALYIGNYSDFVAKRAEEAKWAEDAERAEAGRHAADGTPVRARRAEESPGSATRGNGGRGVRSADVRKLREKVAALEARIAACEAEQAELADALSQASAVQDFARAAQLQQEYERQQELQEQLLAEWEQAAAQLEELESHL